VRGVLRGLHFQRRHPQGKLVAVIRGAVLDVVADVTPGSATFGRHVSVVLEEGTGDQLWVPPGYAHGFVVTSEIADVLYKNTEVYRPEDGAGVRWDDPTLGIDWGTTTPILSPKDAVLPWLADLADRGGRS
jgi:dTDP-4-dehydrorhamnose 3,5-epimerase